MARRYLMPSPDRALYVAAILERIGVNASDEVHLGKAYLVVHDGRLDIDGAVKRLEPDAQVTDP